MEIIKQNRQLIILIMVWTLAGMFGGPVIFILLPALLMIMKSRDMYQELLLGFFYILTISDSRQDSLAWAANAKNEYIVLLTLFLLLDRKRFGHFSYFYQKFIPFFLVAFLCLFFAPGDNLFISFEKTLSYLFLLLVVPNYVLRCLEDNGKEFYKTLMYFVVGILIAGLMLKFLNHQQTYMEGRFRGILGNPNGLGIYVMLIFLMFSVIQEAVPGLFDRREKTVMYIVILLCLLMSGSRNSLFAVLIFWIFSYFYKVSPFLGLILFIVLMVTYQYIYNNLPEIAAALGLSDYLRVDTLEDASGRYIAWNFAMDNIKKSIWLGKGFDYTTYLFEINFDYLSDLGHNGNAHNSYLTLWLDTGLLGIFAYMWGFLGSFIQAAKKSKLSIPILYAIIFSTFFESWLTASLNPFTIQLFIILTILTGAETIKRDTPVTLLVQ